MSRPGTEVVVSDAIPAAAAQTDISVGFMVGEASKGPIEPKAIRSLDTFVETYGDLLPAAPNVYNAVDAFFRDRGARLYFKRLLDGAVAASVEAQDDDDDELFSVESTQPGAWANELRLALVTPTTAAALERASRRPRLTLLDADDTPDAPDAPDPKPAPGARVAAVAVLTHAGKTLERSLELATVGDLIAWSTESAYVRVSAPDAAAALTLGAHDLAGGTDGTVPVVDPTLLLDAALDFGPELGPGQLTAPGKHALTQHEAVLRGAEFGNRVAYLDADPAADEATLTTHVRALRTLEQDRFGGLFAPRAVIPGRALGTHRLVPWSGIQAGLTAYRDQSASPAQPAAGRFGISRAAFDLEVEYDDAARERLMYAGVNTARIVRSSVRGYGFRSLVDPAGPRRAWLQLSAARTTMAIKAESDAQAEDYVFAVVDGRLHKIAEFGGALGGICMRYWRADALFGATSEDAFRVDVGDGVNTPDTIANGEIHGVLLLAVSPFAEWVRVEIVKQAITEAL